MFNAVILMCAIVDLNVPNTNALPCQKGLLTSNVS